MLEEQYCRGDELRVGDLVAVWWAPQGAFLLSIVPHTTPISPDIFATGTFTSNSRSGKSEMALHASAEYLRFRDRERETVAATARAFGHARSLKKDSLAEIPLEELLGCVESQQVLMVALSEYLMRHPHSDSVIAARDQCEADMTIFRAEAARRSSEK